MTSCNENEDNIYQKTDIHITAEQGDAKKLTELVVKGANVSLQDKTNSSPVHYAAARGNLECLKILVEANADYSSSGFRTTLSLQATLAIVPGAWRRFKMRARHLNAYYPKQGLYHAFCFHNPL
eukprot:766573-Hanusia_phi.AAC.5